jgi:hypothetical protein
MPTSGFNYGIVTGKGLVGVEGITLIAEGDGEEVAMTRTSSEVGTVEQEKLE